MRPLVAAILAYALSPARQRRIPGGPSYFLPLTPAQVARSRLWILARGIEVGRRPSARGGARQACTAPHNERHHCTVGYNDMREMPRSLDRLFEHIHPGIRFALTLEGTHTAPAALAAGHSLLAPVGAMFSPQELAAYRRLVGADPICFRIAQDSFNPRPPGPLAFLVPRANPIAHLTFEQPRRMFTDVHPRWGPSGLSGEWANRSMHPYGLARTTALGRFVGHRVLKGRHFSAVFQGLRALPSAFQGIDHSRRTRDCTDCRRQSRCAGL